MFAAEGLSGPLGRAALLVGVVCSVFGALACIIGAKRNDLNVSRLAPRFAFGAVAASVAAFAFMEYALITRDFSLAYVQKVGSRSTHGVRLKVRF